MTRTNPYPMNDPKDYSMLTAPKLHIGSNVVVWDEEEGGEWVQARVVDATFDRRQKCWEYSAIVELVDEDELEEELYLDKTLRIKYWYCFSDEELVKKYTTGETPFDVVELINMYIVIKK